jgi:hypothetical protein
MNTDNKHIKTGFKTPANYFDSIEEKLLNQLSIKTDVQVENKTGFKVPEGYFDSFEKELMNKIKKPEPKVISIFNKKNFYYVASVAAILIFSLFIINPTYSDPITFDDLEYASIEEYINTENLEITAIELADLYGVQTNDLDNISFLNIEDENILEYLSEETTSDYYYDSEL